MMNTLFFAVFLLCILGYKAKLLGERRSEPDLWNIGNVAERNEKINFIIALTQRNLDVLENKFWAVSTPGSTDYRNFMTIGEINDIVAPPLSAVIPVYKWLKEADVTDIKNNGDSLFVKTTVAVAEKLFDTALHYFHHTQTGQTIIRQFGTYSIPTILDHLVHLVSGLSEFPVPHLTLKRSPDSFVSISPPSIFDFYSIPPNTKVTKNSSIGVIEFEDQYYNPSQLSMFGNLFAVQVNLPTADHTVGFNSPTSPQLESTLDIQYVLGIAQNAESWFWIEESAVWLYGFSTHFFSTEEVPLVISISYDWNEEAQCQTGIGDQECQKLGVNSLQYVARVNTEFMKIGLRGISILTASGDSGANGRTDPYCMEDHLNPPYPAASPYVTSVGGTMITEASGKADLPNPPPGCAGKNCASSGIEVAVSFAQARFSSGGGFSVVAGRPSYQNSAVGDYLNSSIKLPPSSYYNTVGRGFPDVAALGSAILIYDDIVEAVGGTSASCPIFAGVIALLNDIVIAKTGKPLGFLNPLLYQMAAKKPSTFFDITQGDNICTEAGCSAACQGFYATKGWDPVSGLGSPVYSEMLAYVQELLDTKGE